MNKIFMHSCEEMPELKTNSVALTVTSPPYWNAIDYDIHANDKSKHYRTRAYAEGYTEYEEYLNWLQSIFSEVFRVTKPGGFCAVVIGTVLQKGRHYPVPFDAITRMARIGWEFHQDIIWHKCTGGVKRAGVTIQKPYPGYYYPNIMTEYILVFKKPGEAIYKNTPEAKKKKSAYPINRVFTMDIANNVWHIAPVPPDHLDHPCPYPEEIPQRLISLYSYQGDLVLDPFAGSGQTLKVAKHLKRKYVGYEIIKKYVDLTEKRLTEPLSLREYQLIATFDKVQKDEPLGGGKRSKKSSKEKTAPPTLF
ncbi:MAG TPA: site-specific DNA-methyltransferase [Anaerolineales bacterium]|nr:site-specific DNA-methyltransferase [Anaerolineales bacterium]